MMLKKFMPEPKKFTKAFVHAWLKRRVQKICEDIGAQRLEYHISHNVPLDTHMPQALKDYYRQVAPQYAWALKLVTEEDLRAMFPAWAMDICRKYSDQGEAWLKQTIEWLKGFFSPPPANLGPGGRNGNQGH